MDLEKPISRLSPDQLKKKLLDAGIQASAPRLAVADYILQTTDHPTAEEVKRQVEKRTPSVSLATIYNSLNLFVERGLLQEVRDPHESIVRYDCNTRPHFHFYDEESGRMYDLDPRLLRIAPDFSKLNESFEVSEIEVTVKGKLRSPSSKTKNHSEGES